MPGVKMSEHNRKPHLKRAEREFLGSDWGYVSWEYLEEDLKRCGRMADDETLTEVDLSYSGLLFKTKKINE